MVELHDLGTAKRFGSRYGKKYKQIFADIERIQRSKHKCPYCHYKKVKRLAFGIWHCKKCNSKFTGRAYTISAELPTEKLEIPNEIIIPQEINKEE